jgi:hypothetical protein
MIKGGNTKDIGWAHSAPDSGRRAMLVLTGCQLMVETKVRNLEPRERVSKS